MARLCGSCSHLTAGTKLCQGELNERFHAEGRDGLYPEVLPLFYG